MNKNSLLDLTEEQRIYFKRIRMIATNRQPYVAEAILRLIPVSMPEIETMAVDKFWRLYIDFDYMMQEGYEYGAGVLSHEVWHLLRKHQERSESINISSQDEQDIWNIAGDLEINDDIMELIPDKAFIPGEAPFEFLEKGKSAEEYFYAIIEKIKAAYNDNSENSYQIENGNSSGAGNNPNNPENNLLSRFDMSNILHAMEHGAKCGSGAGNNKLKDKELTEEEAPTINEYEAEGITKQTARNIKKAVEDEANEITNRQAQNLSIWAEEVLEHKPINWRIVLQNAIKKAVYYTSGQKDYIKTIPNRKQPIPNVVMPAMKSPQPRLAVGIDTSGSNLIKLGLVIEEVMAITKKTGIRGRDLITFNIDESVVDNEITYIKNKKDIKFRGAGGTELNKAFDFVAKKLRKDIDIFILLTDGEYDEWYEQKPKYCGNISFITVIIVDGNNKNTENIINTAKTKLSKWNKVIIIDIAKEKIKEQKNQNIKDEEPLKKKQNQTYVFRPQDFTWTYVDKIETQNIDMNTEIIENKPNKIIDNRNSE